MPTVLLATWRDGLFALPDEHFQEELAGQPVSGLARDSSGNALAIVAGKSLCRRGSDGAWHTIAKSAFELACCVAVGAELYVGANDSAQVLRAGEDGSLVHLAGFDHVAGRDQWYAGTALIDDRLLGPPLGIRSMSATCDRKVLLANVHVGGIPRSINGGVTWHPSIAIDADVHQVCAHPTRPQVVAAATGVGLAISQDAGATWAIEYTGLHAPYCSAVAFAGDDVLVAASADHFASQGAIYRRPIDQPGPLLPVGGGLPRWTEGITDTGNIAASGSTLAVADRAGNLHLSQDAGRTWVRHSEPRPFPSGIFIY